MKHYPCEKTDCITHKRWKNEMPYIVNEDTISAVLVCLACIHCILEDNYLPEEQSKE